MSKERPVNGECYRVMLKEFLLTEIEEEGVGKIWFQQDDAMCHTAEATLDVLRPVFEDRIISRKADVIWRFDTVGLFFVCCRQR